MARLRLGRTERHTLNRMAEDALFTQQRERERGGKREVADFRPASIRNKA